MITGRSLQRLIKFGDGQTGYAVSKESTDVRKLYTGVSVGQKSSKSSKEISPFFITPPLPLEGHP